MMLPTVDGSLDFVLVWLARHLLTISRAASVICSCNRGGDSDFRIFHFTLYSPPVNGHCLDTSVKCENNFAFYTLPNSHFRISYFIPALNFAQIF